MTRRSIEAGKAVIVVDLVDKVSMSFSKITSKLQAAARGLRDIGTGAAGAGLLSGLASRSIIRNFTEFEDKILNLSAKLGYFGILTKQQDSNLKGLTKTIVELGKVTSYTSAEVADAAISLAQAGFSVTEIKASLQSVLDLARGTNYALGESADFLANMIRTFNMFKPGNSAEVLAENMKTVNYVSSMLVKATRLGTVELEDLRQSMKYTAGTAQNLGGNIATVLGLLVQMSESGLKASLGGTSMNVAFLNLIKNLDELQARLPSFRLFKDAANKVDFAATFTSLMNATKGMDVITKTQLFQDVFNIRAARMVSSIQEMDRVQYFIREIALAGEEARLSAAKMESGLGGAIRRLTSGFEALNIAMGYTFKDGATAFANLATVGVASLEKLTERNKFLIGSLLISPIVFAGIAAAAFSLSVILSRLSFVITGLGAALGSLKRFGGMLGSSLQFAGGKVSGALNAKSMKAAAIKKQAEKVAKLEAKIQNSVALAQSRKTAAAQAAGLNRVSTSKTMQQLKAAQAKLASMKSGPGIMGKLKSGAKAIGGKLSALNQVRKERQEIKSQIKLEGLLQKQAKARAAQQFKAVKEAAGVEIPHLKKQQALIQQRNVAEKYLDKVIIKRKAAAQRLYYADLVANKKLKAIQLERAREGYKLNKIQGKANPQTLANYQSQLRIKAELRKKAAEEIAKNSKIAKFTNIQGKAYDRLYRLRKKIAEVSTPIDQIKGAAAGKKAPLTQDKLRQMEIARQKQLLALREREARLTKIVNANTPGQSNFFQRAAKAHEARVHALRQQVVLSQKLDALQQRQATIARMKALHQKEMNFDDPRRNKAAARLKALAKEEQQVKRHIKATQTRIQVQGAQAKSAKKLAAIEVGNKNKAIAKNLAGQLGSSKARVGAARGALAGASYMKTAFSGASMAKTFAAMGKGISIVAQLARSLTMLTFSIGRFVLSWNFVGLVINGLLLFGDKISFVRKAFADIGAGFSAAFSQIGKIAEYAAPAFDLFRIAFEAFVKGDTNVGVTALSSGFSGLVEIISNQLMAAWNAFAGKVAEIWLVIKQIGTSIMMVVKALISGVAAIAGTALAPLMDGIKNMSSGKGIGDTFRSFASMIALTLNNFVTGFAKAIVTFITEGYKFISRLQIAMGEVVQYIPGTGSAGQNIIDQGNANLQIDDTRASKLRADLEIERKEREKAITAVFTESAKEIAKQREQRVNQLNKGSANIQQRLTSIAGELTNQMNVNEFVRMQDAQRLAELQGRPQSSGSSSELPQAIKSFEYKLSALVGSITSVSGNKLLKEKPEEVELQKQTNDKLDKLIRVVETQGM